MSPIHSKPASDAYRRGFDSIFGVGPTPHQGTPRPPRGGSGVRPPSSLKKANRLVVIVHDQDGEVTTLYIDETQFKDNLTLNGQQYKRYPGTNTYYEMGKRRGTDED